MKITIKEAERYFSKKKHWPLLALIIIALIGLVVSAYFIASYSRVCYDEECFKFAVVKCQRAVYIKDNPETIIQYTILGKTQNGCKVNVKVIQIGEGSVELELLKNHEMNCLVPLGAYVKPEENIKNCNGLLKEKIQEIMIQRMHSELLENVGEIGEEITKGLLGGV